MKNKQIIKIASIIIFILLTGWFYSCRMDKNLDTVIITNNDNYSNKEMDTHDSSYMKGTSESSYYMSTDVTVDKSSTTTESEIFTAIYVHLCGEVLYPAVYEVNENTRVFELIELAGGFTENASTDAVNQASMVYDGQQIYIPTKEEVTLGKYETSSDSVREPKDSKININKASLDELMSLPGIGLSKAESIIKYREENNGFRTIEDIMNISGIKDSVFNKISDKIIVK